MPFFLCLIATSIVAAATLLPMSRCECWWVRGLDFPRLQFSTLAGAVLALDILVLEPGSLAGRLLIGAALASLAWHAWWIFPYTPFTYKEVPDAPAAPESRSIRIMTANVLMPNRRADELVRLVRENRPDVLVTLESDQWWQDRLDGLEDEYPHTIKCPLDNLYGMLVYSRLPLVDSRIDFLVEPDVPSIHTGIRTRTGRIIRAHFLHPAPPSPTENESSSERDAELISVGKSVAEAEGPVIVTGDLNDVAWSETTRLFRKISGLLDPRVGRGMFNTFHADHWFIRWPLDHLFHSHHFTLGGIRRLPRFGSDHFALLIHLVLEEEPLGRTNGLELDEEDEELAEEKMADEGIRVVDVPVVGE